jgi:hypothetical protein
MLGGGKEHDQKERNKTRRREMTEEREREITPS